MKPGEPSSACHRASHDGDAEPGDVPGSGVVGGGTRGNGVLGVVRPLVAHRGTGPGPLSP